jgi:hypothetical protein
VLPHQRKSGSAAGKSAGQILVQPDGMVEIIQRALVLLRVGSHAATQFEGPRRRRVAPDRLLAILHREIEASEPAPDFGPHQQGMVLDLPPWTLRHR